METGGDPAALRFAVDGAHLQGGKSAFQSYPDSRRRTSIVNIMIRPRFSSVRRRRVCTTLNEDRHAVEHQDGRLFGGLQLLLAIFEAFDWSQGSEADGH